MTAPSSPPSRSRDRRRVSTRRGFLRWGHGAWLNPAPSRRHWGITRKRSGPRDARKAPHAHARRSADTPDQLELRASSPPGRQFRYAVRQVLLNECHFLPPLSTSTRVRHLFPNASRQKSLIEWAIVIVVAVLVSLLIRTYVFQTFYIPSGSMEPTLQVGDRIIVDKLAVEFGTFTRATFWSSRRPRRLLRSVATTWPTSSSDVIGVPGDHLKSVGNDIYVNGKLLKQPWTMSL